VILELGNWLWRREGWCLGRAWISTISLLKEHLAGRTGHLLLEFNIPRMGLRVDAVLLVGGSLLMLEFKVNERGVSTEARNQVWEYALDTKNFHEPSHALPIVPALIPTAYHTDALFHPENAVPLHILLGGHALLGEPTGPFFAN
jgi:hypothetical protein